MVGVRVWTVRNSESLWGIKAVRVNARMILFKRNTTLAILKTLGLIE